MGALSALAVVSCGGPRVAPLRMTYARSAPVVIAEPAPSASSSPSARQATCAARDAAPYPLSFTHETQKKPKYQITLTRLRSPLPELDARIDDIVKEAEDDATECMTSRGPSKCDITVDCEPTMNADGVLSGACEVTVGWGWDRSTQPFAYLKRGTETVALRLKDLFTDQDPHDHPRLDTQGWQAAGHWDDALRISTTSLGVYAEASSHTLDWTKLDGLVCPFDQLASAKPGLTLGHPLPPLACETPEAHPALKITRHEENGAMREATYSLAWFTTGEKGIDDVIEALVQQKRAQYRRFNPFYPNGENACAPFSPGVHPCSAFSDCHPLFDDGHILSVICIGAFVNMTTATNEKDDDELTFERTASGYRELHVKDVIRDIDEFRIRFPGYDYGGPMGIESMEILVDGDAIRFYATDQLGFAVQPADLGDLLACPLRSVALTPTADATRR